MSPVIPRPHLERRNGVSEGTAKSRRLTHSEAKNNSLFSSLEHFTTLTAPFSPAPLSTKHMCISSIISDMTPYSHPEPCDAVDTIPARV